MKKLAVLIPTANRTTALATTLTSLCSQTFTDFDIVISDQSTDPVTESRLIQSIVRVLEFHGQNVQIIRNIPFKGMAQQRHFLLEHAATPYVLYLDDDLILEPWAIENMMKAIEEEQCGYVGMAVAGLSFIHDFRAHQQYIEFWEGPVQPEEIKPKSEKWERYKLHNAANMLHVQQNEQLTPKDQRKYKVAWVGGCTLYNTDKLRDIGGFSFWTDLPQKHCGEDVLAQLRVMKKYGGCGILPTGVYHLEQTTTIDDRRVNAPEVLEI